MEVTNTTTTSTGILAREKGTTATSLTATEYETLSAILKILREQHTDSLGYEPLEHYLVRKLVYSAKGDKFAITDYLSGIYEHLHNSHPDEPLAILHEFQTNEVDIISSETDLKTLQAFRRLQARGGWLDDFLATAAGAWCNDGYYPTPTNIMFLLMEEYESFENSVEDAKDMLQRFPKLFRDELGNGQGIPPTKNSPQTAALKA